MKQILLFIVCLLGLGTMRLHAQQNKENEVCNETIALINARQFLIKANTLYSQDEKRFYTVNPQCNFLLMDCERAKLQVTNNEHIGFYEEHKVSDVKIKVSKKGDVLLTALLKDSRKAIRMKIKLKKETNSCEVVFSSAKRSGNYTFIGELCPLDVSTIVKLY